jgi:UDP-N-acetylglucosamine 4,6-dehydratase
MIDWSTKTVLITGGTGSLGNALVEHFCRMQASNRRGELVPAGPKAIRIFSRDELKQSEMRQRFSLETNLRFLIGDVRDADRLSQAMEGVDIVIHAAAMKRIESCEYNPFEAVKTNVVGTQNVVTAAIDTQVERVMVVSSDKAVNPANLYGATKHCAEKIAVQSNVYVGTKQTLISCVRYGNVVGSRGSIVPLFKEQAKAGVIAITDPRMTRFWITLDQAVAFITSSIEMMRGGEVFVPKLPSMRVTDLALALAPTAEQRLVGIRPGEKLHEQMITPTESRYALDLGDRFVIEPTYAKKRTGHAGNPVEDGFSYSSDVNDNWLSEEQLLALI